MKSKVQLKEVSILTGAMLYSPIHTQIENAIFVVYFLYLHLPTAFLVGLPKTLPEDGR